MAKLYTKNTWIDEQLAAAERYRIATDGDVTIHDDVIIELATAVLTAGSAVDADKMNNLEDGIDNVDTVLNILSSANVETLADDKVLTDADVVNQLLDPGGAGRDVTMPAIGAGNHQFMIANLADAVETLTVKDAGGSAIGIIARGEAKILISDGSIWVLVSISGASTGSGGGSYATILALGG